MPALPANAGNRGAESGRSGIRGSQGWTVAGSRAGPTAGECAVRRFADDGFRRKLRVSPDSRRILPPKHASRSDTPLHALTVPPQVSSADRLGITIFFAILAHLIVILGVTFSPEDRPRQRVETLDVVLVPLRSETAPEHPDHLAQANWVGGGDNTEKVRPTTPLTSPVNSSGPAVEAVEPALTPVEPLVAVAANDAARTSQTEIEPARNPAPVSSDGTAIATISPGALFTEPSPGGTNRAEAVPDSAVPIEAIPAEAVPDGAVPIEAIPAEATPAEAIPVEASARESATADAVLIAAEQPLAQLRRTPVPPVSRPAVEPGRVEPEPTEEAPGSDGSSPASFPAPVPDAEAEASRRRALAMAALSAEIERDLRAYAERPRRKWISASTREHRFAAYMDAWRRKIEKIGNLNYPEEAERRGLAGDLLLDVAIRPDGTVEEIALRRSSGERVLDDAAIRIVEIAAPFEEFPEDIAEDVDILHIERTWIFHSGHATTSR